MKTPRLSIMTCILGAATLLMAPVRAEDLNVGDPAERVRAVLGEPRGTIRSGTVEMMQFDRGRVIVRDGVVAEVELVSAAEAETLKQERARQAESLRLAREAWREQQRVAGLEALDRALNSPEFQNASGARQVEFWDNFRRRYPEVGVEPEYASALARRDAEAAQAATERRLAEMEARVAEADARAREAEAEAKEAKRDSRRRYVYYPGYSYGRYPYPVCPPSAGVHRTTSPYIGYGYGMFGSPYVQRPSSIPAPSSGITVNFSN